MNPQFPTLFIRDSKGKERQWTVWTEGSAIIVEHGLVEGKKTQKKTVAKAKNKGKANETTPEQQALLEAQSKWNFQVEREDYHQNINMAGLQLRPMLALDYLKVPHRVRWDAAIAQPKLDGLRLTAGSRYVDGRESPFEMMTRKGETYKVPHMEDPCVELLNIINARADGKCIALDGEAYIHGLPLQQITSRARKYQKGLTEELQYWLFDLIIPGMTFIERYNLMTEAVADLGENTLFNIVPVDKLDSDNINTLQGAYMELGYEGLMIRHSDSEYGIASRSPDLFKYKQFFDDEFCIIDVWEDNNNNAMFTVEIREGQKLKCNDHVSAERLTFDCTPKRTHDERKVMLANASDYVGKWITVKYQALTDDGKPQFPVGLAIRECDENGNPLV